MRNKKIRNLIIGCILVLFTVMAIATVQPRENLSLPEKALRTIATPFQYAFKGIGDGVGGFFSYFTDKGKLQQENQEMKRQISQLNMDLSEMEEIRLENIRLKELLDYKTEVAGQYDLMMAEIIAENNNNLQHTVTLNRGSNDGVKTGMAVLNPDGLIGRISAVMPGSSEVMLLTDRESAVGARVRSTREAIGVLQGDGTSGGMLQMIHLQHDAEIYVGDVIITSGLDNVFPAGIRMGEVTAIVYASSGLTKTAYVKPYVNFTSLEDVFIVMNSGGGESQ